MIMIKKFLLILFLGFTLQACTAQQALQRLSQAEVRAHDFAVAVLDERKADRAEIRRIQQNHVRDLGDQARKLIASGDTKGAAKLMNEAVALIKKNTPSIIDSIKHIREIWSAVKGDFKE